MSSSIDILKLSDEFVFDLFKKSDTTKLVFHNYRHTYDVVESAELICEGEKLTKDDKEVVLLAAYFHDVGYLTSPKNHEEKSIEVAKEFLIQNNYPKEKIEQVENCIVATKMGAEPQTILEEIIRDADMYGLGSKVYEDRSKLLRVECGFCTDKANSDVEWLEQEIVFLSGHQYNTKTAFLKYNQIKLSNLIAKHDELKKLKTKDKGADKKNQLKEKELELKTQKAEVPEKGIETMFRTALKNHMELSAIADNKANIMLSINALILSIIISTLFSKFDKHPELMIPSVFMLVVCLITIVLATLSTKPKILTGKFSTEDVKNRKANLLFFGNFHKMELKDYEWGMKEIMKDKEYLYSSLIRDLYFLGVVLARKYNYLRICYIVFMYGMIVSVLLFGVFMMLSNQSNVTN
jgi:HD superfamily phosphodiesterase